MQNSQEAMQEAIRIAKTPEGQQLLQLLQQSNPEALRSALSSAAAGNLAQAKSVLNSLLNTPEAQKLLNRMGGTDGQRGR